MPPYSGKIRDRCTATAWSNCGNHSLPPGGHRRRCHQYQEGKVTPPLQIHDFLRSQSRVLVRVDAADVDCSGQEPQKFLLAARPASSRAPSISPSQARSSLSEINQRIEMCTRSQGVGSTTFRNRQRFSRLCPVPRGAAGFFWKPCGPPHTMIAYSESNLAEMSCCEPAYCVQRETLTCRGSTALSDDILGEKEQSNSKACIDFFEQVHRLHSSRRKGRYRKNIRSSIFKCRMPYRWRI